MKKFEKINSAKFNSFELKLNQAMNITGGRSHVTYDPKTNVADDHVDYGTKFGSFAGQPADFKWD